ncbi:MAG: RdgB/HAM1 family non-canonical purine NTP pyrophosphatase [Anaerolineaceae bacterium]|nr:RdgB/HAM1 family non-canonical purine NTP pyrophosphatase [Anaerolineaceae bacterium]
MAKAILIATTNKGKLGELLSLFASENITLLSPQNLSLSLKVKETGSSYKENACLKATAFCKASGLPALADDSGLEVDALNGAPGLYSARFSPKPNATDADRRALLLKKLSSFPQPWAAHFTCTMALAMPDGNVYTSNGLCHGKIIDAERGTFGFGYDPIFFCEDAQRTMAELQMKEKNRISHRARAAAGIRPFIRSYLKSG